MTYRKLTIATRLAALVLSFTAFCTPNAYALAPTGTVIVNVADMDYTDPIEGSLKRISNPAYVKISTALAVDLQDDQTLTASPSQTVNFGHRVTNTGNVADSYNLQLQQLASDAGNFVSPKVFLDINENGIADAGEPEVTQTATLRPEEFVHLVVVAQVPASASQGDDISLTLAAVSTTDGSVQDINTDTVLADTNNAILVINKDSSEQCKTPLIFDQQFTYSVNFTNVGSQLPVERTVTVDGINALGVVLSDALPVGVSLLNQSPGVAPVQGRFLVQFGGDARDSWTSFDNWNGIDPVSKVGVIYPAAQLATNVSGSFDFAVKVNSQALPGLIENTVSIDIDGDVSDSAEFTSNIACNTVVSSVSFDLDPDVAIQISLSPSATPVVFTHTLSNNGLTDDSYILVIAATVNDSGDLSDNRIFIDNGDGIFDEAVDTLYTGTPVAIATSNTATLFVSANVPGGFDANDSLVQTLTATSQVDTTISDSHTETVTFRPSGAAFSLLKATSRFCEVIAVDTANQDSADRLAPGEQFTYSISFTNDGDSAPSAQNYNVDGSTLAGALLQDRLPFGIQMVAGQSFSATPVGGQVVLMRFEDRVDNNWISYGAWNGTDPIFTVAVLYPVAAVGPDATGSFSFDVSVVATATASAEFYNTAFFDTDNDGTADSSSNQVCNLVQTVDEPGAIAPQAQIRFLSPTLDLILARVPPAHASDTEFVDTTLYRLESDVVGYEPSTDGVFIEVTSSTLREGDDYIITDDGRRQVVVDVESVKTGDTAKVVLRETSPGSGVYRSIRPLILSDVTPNGGGVCPEDQTSAIEFTAAVVDACRLLSQQDDDLIVSITDTGINKKLEDDAIVDPLGIVFDSTTLQPVAGATVVVCTHLPAGESADPAFDDGIADDQCGLFGEIAIDPFSSTRESLPIQITGADGFYQYAFLFAGDYFIDIDPPTGYAWPSDAPATNFDGLAAVGRDRTLEVLDPSYGIDGFRAAVADSGVFTLNVIRPILVVDLPVDPVIIDLDVSSNCDANGRVAGDVGPLTYSVSFLNSGNLTPPERTIQVDGVDTSGVLFESRLPFETTPIAGTTPILTPGGAALVQTYSDLGTNNWIAFATWDGIAAIAQVGALFSASDVEPGEAGTIAIEVNVTGNLTDGTALQNTISVDVDADGSADSVTQSACSVSGPNAEIRFLSPTVALRTASQPPEFTNDDDFVDIQQYLLVDSVFPYNPTEDGVYIQFDSTAIPDTSFTVLADGRRQVIVDVISNITGETTQVVLQEIGEGQGNYRSIRPLVLAQGISGSGAVCPPDESPVVDYVGDPGPACILRSAPGDNLTVVFFDNLGRHDDQAIVDPLGVVFDSQTLAPVAGATVSIRDTNGDLAVNPFNGRILDPQVTTDDGRYHYPFLLPGTYYLDVIPPPEYSFPSIFSPAVFTNSNRTVVQASYGRNGFSSAVGAGEFTLDAANPLLIVDFPLDLFGDAILLIDKTVAQNEVELGGIVEYTVSVKNVGEGPVSNIVLDDKIPYGFKFVKKTLRVADIKVADPSGAPGPLLQINVGSLAKDEEIKVKYFLQATAGAVDSDGINTAIARGDAVDGTVESNIARAKVELLRRGVLSDKAYIFGKVYMDSDCNNIQSEGEWPIGAVKIYMEDGTYAITDENGQYSLYGLEPGLHIVKVDPLTMPTGLTLKPIDNRHAADGDSRFTDLVSGEYHRADFAAACPAVEMIEDIQTKIIHRNQAINANWMLDEAERFNPTKRSSVRTDVVRANGDLSQGIIGSAQTYNSANGQVGLGLENQSPIVPTLYNAADNLIVIEPEPDNKMPLTEDVVKTVTAVQAKTGEWLWPLDDVSLYGRFMVVIRTGISPVLYLNGEAVSNDQLGEQFINKRERAQVLAWYGLQLKPGPNLLEVKGKDPFGNMRTLASKIFNSPGEAEKLVVKTQATLPADGGRSAAEVKLSLLDAFGQPARGVHFVTLEVSDGLWVETDIQDLNPGFQARVRNGQATLHLRSSEYTGDVAIKASVDQFEAETELTFVASNRSLVVAGVAEAGYSQGSVSDKGYGPTDQDDGFDESELETRAAVFLKGRIKGDMHLTLSYDTDKNSDEDLLRNINPNEYYPIPGDNSIRGFEAQTRSKLYAKLEKNRHSLLWGDYVTDLESSYRDLGRVQRTLTGIRGIYDDGRLRALAFGAQEEDDFQTIELAANGTALLYSIPGAPIVRNSEVIELLSRDRDSRALIVSSETLQRFVDYTVDYLSGGIRFVRALPTLDEDLNPNFIRISFNVEGDGTEHTVAGARIEYDVNSKVTVGANYTVDENPRSGDSVGGVFVNLKPTDRTNIMVSTATMSHEDATADGDAVLLEIKHQWNNGSNTTATYGKADQGFTNSGAGISADNEETRVNHLQKITNNLNLAVDYLDSETTSTGKQRESLEARADYKLKEWTLRAGSRAITNSGGGSDDKANTIIVGAGRSFSLLGRGGNINAEYEVETGDSDRQRWATDATWQAFEKAKVYGRYEQLNSLSGTSGLTSKEEQTSASFGVESDWLPSTTVYNEYRMRGVTDSRNLEAATGVRGDYEIIPGLRVSPNLEVINTMDGITDNSSTAVSFGLNDSRDKNARKLMRVETRFDNSRKYYGFDGTYVARVNLEWSSFFREDLRLTENKSAENTLNHVFTVGLARRPRLENRYHGLWLYQWKVDKGSLDREVHLFSTHQNLQINDDWVVSGRFGFKVEEFDLLGENFATNAGLIDGRLIWDITRRIDIDVHGGMLATNSGDELRYSFGLGANLLLNRNLRLNVGYNVAGFEEKDLDGEGYNANGGYIGLQFKFDEKAFDWLAYDPTQVLETDQAAESGNE